LAVIFTLNVVPNSLILFTLKTEADHTTETSVLTRVLRCHIPEAGILQIYCCYVQKRDSMP
jgi:hypothetical protein